ncbi:MAG: tRNA-dependent cyclodipeptide synthase [Phycisphaerales bacterium]|nr:tRNA-dependent cyclodipeptide synthase [Phycisphaerales bacterium]
MIDTASPSPQVQVIQSETHGRLVSRFLNGERFNCWIGLSPSTSSVNRARLEQIVNWVCARSDDVLIVEGSFPDRWNIMAEKALPEVVAEGEARAGLPRFRRRLDDIVARLGANARVRLLNWEETLQTIEYKRLRHDLSAFITVTPRFAMAVEEASRDYLERRGKRSDLDDAPRRRLWLQYMVEELAMFMWLYQSGYMIEVYPGRDLELMQLISEGAFPGIPVACPNRTHIGIEVSER